MNQGVFISKPSQELSSVRYLGAMEESEAAFNHRMNWPDSHPGVLINFGAPLTMETAEGKQIELPRIMFGGVQKRYLKIRATGACKFIGMDMQAWGTRFLVDDEVNLVNMPFVPLGGIWNDFAQTLEAAFAHHNEAEALALLDQFVADLHQRKRLEISSIRTAIDYLYQTNGKFNLPELAARCYLSPSQLGRQFKYYVGVSPKTFARAVRFDAALAALIKAPARQTPHLAQRFGYTDQAHFIHEFKGFVGCTPNEFLASRT